MAGMMTTGSMKAVGQGLLRTGTRSLASQASKSALSLHQSLLNAPETKVTPFSNGVRVASETHAGGETATVGVWIEAGTRDETEANHGASHLIERLIFKGHGKKTQADLEREVESMGGQLHAYTTRDHTAIYAKVLKGDVPKAVSLLSEIVQNTNFSADAVEKEKQKVIKSISESESETQEVLFDHLYATAFQGSSLGRNLTGTAKSVASLTASDLGAFVKDNFAGSRIVVSGAGAVNHDELAKLAESTFGKLPAGAPRKAQRSRFVGSEIRLRDDTVDDAHILFAAESVGASHPDYYPMMVAQFILGSWDSSLGGGKNLASKLSQHIAEHGLCHSYTTFNTSFADTGLFGLYITSSSRTRLDDLMYQFQQEWVRLGVNVSEGEAEIAKNQLKAALLMRLNSTSSIATDIGTSILLRDQRPSLHETLSQIDAVTASSVQKAAYKHLYDRDPAVVAYGPIEGFPDYNRVQTATSWLRV